MVFWSRLRCRISARGFCAPFVRFWESQRLRIGRERFEVVRAVKEIFRATPFPVRSMRVTVGPPSPRYE
jgi:hypothetical protein